MLLQVSVPFPHRISVEGMFHPPSVVVTTQLHAYWGSTLHHHRLPRHLQTPYVCEESSSPFYVSSCPVHATRSELEQGQICHVNDQERIDTNTISTTQLTATSKVGSPIDCCHSMNTECNLSKEGSIVSQELGLRSLCCLFVMPLPKPLKPISCCTKDKAYGMSSNGISLNMEGMNSICLSVNIAITTL